jgi:hypothetical protein
MGMPAYTLKEAHGTSILSTALFQTCILTASGIEPIPEIECSHEPQALYMKHHLDHQTLEEP